MAIDSLMLFDFHDHLRRAGIKVSLTEWLNLIDGLSKSVGTLDIDGFYSFARLCLVKNESLYDRFDQVFRDYWAGREQRFDELADSLAKGIPDEWLKLANKDALTDEQKAQVEALGGWDKLMAVSYTHLTLPTKA